MERFAKLAVGALNQVLESPVTERELEMPPDPKLGDFAFPCFKLSKALRKAPPQIAKDLTEQLKNKNALPPGIEAIPTGPYVNFKVDQSLVVGALLGDILKGPGLGEYGKLASAHRGQWVLEYSSPNISKPMMIHHLRPTALGAALDRIGRYRGFDVISINHLGDWGTQYGKLAIAYGMFGKDLPNPTINDLVTIYVKFHQAAETDPSLEDRAREAFAKLEKKDPEVTALWKKCLEIALKDFNRTYDLLGVKFDHYWGESFYQDQLKPLIADLKKRGILVESEGAWVVHVTDPEGRELPPCILEKSDGTTIYASRDVAAAVYRREKFNFDRMTYIVGQDQRLHFQQLFAVLRKMGHEWVSKCEHVPFGLYRFKDVKMSTRKGNFVTFDEVFQLARTRVLELMEARAKAQDVAPLPSAELEAIATKVAVGALVFHDLHSDPARDVDFDLEKVVDFEGETGPYLQYAHTRCVSILRKAAETKQGDGAFDPAIIGELKRDEEVALLKLLGQLSMHLERTLTHAKASQLAHYLIDVTQAYGVFYRECHVLGEKPELTRARLMLVEATRRVLARGMGLLGIPLPDRM